MSKRRKEIFFGLNGSVIRFFQAHSKKFKCHFCLKSHLSFVLFVFDRNDFFWSIEFYVLCLRWRTTFMCRSILVHFQQIQTQTRAAFSLYLCDRVDKWCSNSIMVVSSISFLSHRRSHLPKI